MTIGSLTRENSAEHEASDEGAADLYWDRGCLGKLLGLLNPFTSRVRGRLPGFVAKLLRLGLRLLGLVTSLSFQLVGFGLRLLFQVRFVSDRSDRLAQLLASLVDVAADLLRSTGVFIAAARR